MNSRRRRKGRNLQQAVFIDSTGRAYSLDAHQLPAARGYGEPLSGTRRSAGRRHLRRRADRRAGGSLAAGERRRLRIQGRGLRSSMRATSKGKSVLKVPENARVLPAQPIAERRGSRRAGQQRGRGARPSGAEIEEMSAGKGQNLYGIPGKKSAERDEYLVAMAVVAPGELLTVYSGNSAPMKLKLRGAQAVPGQEGPAPAAVLAGLQAGRPARGDRGPGPRPSARRTS